MNKIFLIYVFLLINILNIECIKIDLKEKSPKYISAAGFSPRNFDTFKRGLPSIEDAKENIKKSPNLRIIKEKLPPTPADNLVSHLCNI